MKESPGSKRLKRGNGGVGRTGWESIPDAISAEIFSLLPAEDILRSCALVCKSWRSLTRDQTLWSQLCEGSGLRHEDAKMYFGGWRGLYGAVFGTNLIASPHFERIHHMDANYMKSQPLMLWEAKHRLLFDRICWEDEVSYEDFQSFSHWQTEGGCLFQRGGGDGIIREQPPLGLPPCPGAPDKPVIATSREWGKVAQYVGLQAFPPTFLDVSPPVMLSVWYGPRQDVQAVFRVQMHFRNAVKATLFAWYVVLNPLLQNADPCVSADRQGVAGSGTIMAVVCRRCRSHGGLLVVCVYVRDSGELRTDGPHWKEVRRLIRGYPPVRAITS